MLKMTCPLGHKFQAESLARVKCPECAKEKRGTAKPCPVRVLRHAPPQIWSIDLPGSVESQNKTTYSHWSAHAGDKSRWVRLLAPVSAQLGGTYRWSRWTITRFWSPPSREMDYGNLVGGCKSMIDVLVKQGVLYDDRPSCFVAEYVQTRCDAPTHMTLTLEEYELGNETDTAERVRRPS